MTKVKKRIKKASKVTTFEGLPIIDAGEDVHLAITKKDVTTSRKKDPYNCAAALAGRREFKADVRVYMSRTYVKDQKHKRWIRFVTPQAITKEIISFDRGASFEPGEYVLKAPTISQALGYKVGGHGPETGTGKKKRPHHYTANVRVRATEKVSPASGK